MSRQPRPPFGLCLPVRKSSIRVVDGDTVEVGFISNTIRWKLRLIDCWVDDKDPKAQAEGRKGAKEFVKGATDFAVWIPMPAAVLKLMAGLLAWVNPLKAFTFDRIPAHLYLDHELTLSEAMVLAGYATLKKPKKSKPASP